MLFEADYFFTLQESSCYDAIFGIESVVHRSLFFLQEKVPEKYRICSAQKKWVTSIVVI